MATINKGILAALLLMYWQMAVASNMADEDSELLLFFEEEELIEIASKRLQSLNKAPAIVSVVTRREIRNMGARNLGDVLQRVPGFGISKQVFGKTEIEVRGIKTIDSEKLKLLVDGHSVSEYYTGGASWVFHEMGMDDVKRIEIIRGPGSALYGSGAFVGVVNVVTKTGTEINGVRASVAGGSFDTKKYYIEASTQSGDLEMAFTLGFLETDGPESFVKSDKLGNSGNTRDYDGKTDVGLKVKYKDISFSTRFVGRRHGDNIGVGSALNDESALKHSKFFAELKYDHEIDDSRALQAKFYLDQMSTDSYFEILPEGTGPFVNGMLGNPSASEKGHGLEIVFDQQLSDNNYLTVGAVAENNKLTDAKHLANFDPKTFAPLPSFQDVSNGGNFIDDSKTNRDIWAVYLQDIWTLSDDLELTAGVRHDDYSDFGSSTNPRIAAVWSFKEDWDLKTMYGSAFRAPSFAQLYLTNNPTYVGNEHAKAEKTDTFEVALAHDLSSDSTIRATYFHNKFKDRLDIVATTPPKYDNVGSATIQGIELEWEHDLGKHGDVYANYTYLDTEDNATGQRIEDVAENRGNLGGNYRLNNIWNLNLNILTVGDKTRAPGDGRPSVKAYNLVDLSLLGKEIYKGLELRAAVHNVFDQDDFDPAANNSVSSDIPRAGRSVMIEAAYKLW